LRDARVPPAQPGTPPIGETDGGIVGTGVVRVVLGGRLVLVLKLGVAVAGAWVLGSMGRGSSCVLTPHADNANTQAIATTTLTASPPAARR
jgi:hypothetical protein